MALKKCGICVECEHCQYAASRQAGSFDVAVPIHDSESGTRGVARLHCRVSADRHEVELIDWATGATPNGRPAPEIQQRLNTALGFVAEHQLCGNQRICPAEVVQIVGQQAGRSR